jgi:penicillin amidase
MRCAGLERPVEILRDELGVAHVRATSAADAFFGQGYACAQDRLWQMEHDRRRACGRWAEAVGETAVSRDVFMRRMGLARAAERDFAALGAEARAMLEAYARGVNACLAAAESLPAEYALTGLSPEPWLPWHSLAVYKLRHAFMGPLYRKLWRASLLRACGPELVAALRADATDGETLSVPPGSDSQEALLAAAELAPCAEALGALESGDGASNHWVVSGARSASGKPLLAGDPHRTLDLPNVYWPCHLASDSFGAIGLAFAGVPGLPHFGHNAHVAWSITHGMADDQDLFVERMRPEDLGDFERRRETVSVRGGAPVEVECFASPRGPIVLGGPEARAGIALAWTSLSAPDPTFGAFVLMLRAASTAELDGAFRDWVTPCNNVLSADVHGSIRYRFRGRVPVRHAANRWAPVPGWRSEFAWRGAVPFAELPALADPPGGMLAAANNRPAAVPYLGVDFLAAHRVRRILTRLESLERATADDMLAIHADDLSLAAPLFVRALDALAPSDARTRDALAELRRFDGHMRVESLGAALYAAFREQLTLLAGEALGLLGGRLESLGEVVPAPERLALLSAALPSLLAARWTPAPPRPAFDWKELAAQAFARALAFLEARLGPQPSDWRYGGLHRSFSWHPLAVDWPEARKLRLPPSVPMAGDGDTVLCGQTVPGFGLRATTVSVARYVFDLGDWERSAWALPHGVSGDPASPHWSDQLLAWAELRLHPMRFAWREIESHATSRTRLTPGGG